MPRSALLSLFALLVALPAATGHSPREASADAEATVAIDLRPGDPDNRVNLRSRGTVAVALLGSGEFDVATVDVATVRFGPGAAGPRGNRARRRDLNRDGFDDLLLRFRIREAAIGSRDGSVRVAGSTRAGRPFGGADAVVPLGGAGSALDPSLVLEFAGTDLDQDGGSGHDAAASTASFNGTVPGAVAAVFLAASGNGRLGDFDPATDTVLSTDSPEAEDGAFHFRSIRIREGVTVTLAGPLPARLLSLRGVLVEGTLDASGTAGAMGEAGPRTADLPLAAGGAGGPGAGSGGGSWTGASVTAPGGGGQDGPGGGGKGGTGGAQKDPPNATYNFGGGGGGGGMGARGMPGQAGNYPSLPAANAPGGAGGGTGGIVPASTATGHGADFHSSGVGGAGGGAGGNSSFDPADPDQWRNGGAGGGGGGGAVLLQSAGDVTIRGSVLARGGAGGDVHGDSYAGAAGGGGSGGTIAVYSGGRVDLAGATLDASGGAGGLFVSGWQGSGGAGGSGRIHIEDRGGSFRGAAPALVLPEYTTGSFRPVAGPADPPSVFVSTWFATGARGSRLLPFRASDFSERVPPGTGIRYEVQMAAPDPADPRRADAGAIDAATGAPGNPLRASPWLVVKDAPGGIQDRTDRLNGRGYAFLRVRITFTLPPGHGAGDPLPSVERLRIPLAE